MKTPQDPVDAIIEQWATVRPDLDTAAMEVFGRVFRLARTMGDRMEKAYAPYGISRGEFDVLATLRRSDAPYTLSPRQLGDAHAHHRRHDRAPGQAGARGAATALPDPHDRRGLQVTLTDKGLRLIDEAVGAGLAVQTEALAHLDEERAGQLAALLRELLMGAGA